MIPHIAFQARRAVTSGPPAVELPAVIQANAWSQPIWALQSGVGVVPRAAPIKVPGVDASVPGMAVTNQSGGGLDWKQVTITGTDRTISGWDFTGCLVLVRGARTTVEDCKFAPPRIWKSSSSEIVSSTYALQIGQGSDDVLNAIVRYCDFDGGEGKCNSAVALGQGAARALVSNSRFRFFAADNIKCLSSSITDADRPVIQDCYSDVGGYGSPAAHFDAITVGRGGARINRVLFNETPRAGAYGLTNAVRCQADTAGFVIDNVLVEDCVSFGRTGASLPFQNSNDNGAVGAVRYRRLIVAPNGAGNVFGTSQADSEGTAEITGVLRFPDGASIPVPALKPSAFVYTPTLGSVTSGTAAGVEVGSFAAFDINGDAISYALQDNAGGRFAIGSGTKLVTGLVTTDFGSAQSHALIVRISDVGGKYMDRSVTITVSPPSGLPETTTPLARSINFGPRNGDFGVYRRLTGPTTSAFFGSGGVNGGLPGAVMVRAAIDKGALYSASGGGASASPFNVFCPLMSTSSAAAFSIMYYGIDRADTNAQGSLANRVRARITEQGGANVIDIRSAEWIDNDPRLVVLRSSGTGSGTTTFRLDLVRLDGTIDAGEAVNVSAWRGTTIAPALNIGATGAATGSITNLWPGLLADLAIVRNYEVTDADLIAIGKGRKPSDVVPSVNISRYWAMDAIAGDRTVAMSAGADANAALTEAREAGAADPLGLLVGAPLSGAFNGTKGLWLHSLADGYVAGTPYDNPNAAQPLPVSVSNLGGGATHIQARVVNAGSGTAVVPWTRITGSPLADGASVSTTITAPACTDGWYRIEARREDDVEVRTGGRLCGVGPKIVLDGQSQMEIFALTAAASTATALLPLCAAPASPNLSYVTVRGSSAYRRPVDAAILRARTQASAGIAAIGQRLAALQPGRVFQLLNCAIQGTSRRDFYNNNQRSPAATPGTGNLPGWSPTAPYPLWGDGVTVGSGVVTDVIRTACKGDVDFTAVMSMPSWSDAAYRSTMAGMMGRLMLGTDYAAAGDTGLPAGYYAKFAPKHPLHLAMHVHQRFRQGYAYQSDTLAAFKDKAHTIVLGWRDAGAATYAGMTASISHYAPDILLETPAESAHQSFNEAAGNRRVGAHWAYGLLRTAGLLAIEPRIFPTAAVLGGGGATITVAIGLANGGALVTGDGRPAVTGFEVSADGGSTWSATGFGAAISGSAVVLTKDTGNWSASGLQVRYGYGGPNSLGCVVSANEAAFSTANQSIYDTENAALGGSLYETHPSVGIVAGLPVLPIMTTTAALAVA